MFKGYHGYTLTTGLYVQYTLVSRAGRYQKNDDGTVLVQNITVLLNITVLHKSLLHTLLSL